MRFEIVLVALAPTPITGDLRVSVAVEFHILSRARAFGGIHVALSSEVRPSPNAIGTARSAPASQSPPITTTTRPLIGVHPRNAQSLILHHRLPSRTTTMLLHRQLTRRHLPPNLPLAKPPRTPFVAS